MRKIFCEPLDARMLLNADLTPDVLPTEQPIVIAPGDRLDLDIRVRNLGTSAALPAQVSVSLSADTTVGNLDDVSVNAALITGLINAGASQTLRLSSAIPTSLSGRSYFVIVRVNASDRNQANNTTRTGARVVQVITQQLSSATIVGTAESDRISFKHGGARWQANINGVIRLVPASFSRLIIDAGAGNDRVVVEAPGRTDLSFRITGSGGNDTIIGSDADDELSGANGSDSIRGGGGDDYIIGGASKDRLFGDAGDDTLSGAGGNDILTGGLGTDQMIGGSGNDRFFAQDATRDTLSGGPGTDTVSSRDSTDILAGIEVVP